MKKWEILAHHKWVYGATITESCFITDDTYRSFVATIRGFRNWHIWTGPVEKCDVKFIKNRVESIRNRIDANDKSVFLLK